MMRPLLLAALAAATVLTLAACGEDAASPDSDSQLASVVPAAGATNVNPGAPVVVEFTHGMVTDMAKYMVLHKGTVTGPAVAGSWSWSNQQKRATFTPAASLESNATYTLHLGGMMYDAQGHSVGFGQHAGHTNATGGMMNGGRMGGGQMGGGVWADSMMNGPSWRGTDGNFGMVLSFTTA